MDRKLELLAWTQNVLSDSECYIKPASSDASFRSYGRVFSKSQTYIVMDAPVEHEDCKPFIKVAKLLEKSGVNVPKVLAKNLEDGFLLLSDLGTVQYLSKLDDENFESLYSDAIISLHKIQASTSTNDLPCYDDELLKFELSLFRDWFIGRHLDVELTDEQNHTLNECYELLTKNALEQPQTFVHRDYHSRNLMKTKENNPGIIDFQDAVIGPVTYDLVSLLRDCYISWNPQWVYETADKFRNIYNESNQTDISEDQWRRWFDLMGIQRHLKAIGIFCRLNYRDNKPQYLKDINRTLCYVKSVCNVYPELEQFLQLINNISPSIETICEQ